MSTVGQLPAPRPTPPTSSPALGPVADDWEAAKVWLTVLRNRGVSAATLDTYGREVRRLQWYCATQDGGRPSAWTFQDADAYIRFLSDDAEAHVCPRGLRPGEAGWTPFRGALSAGVVGQVCEVLHTMFGFWKDTGHASWNPFAGQVGRRSRSAPWRRALPPAAVQHVLDALEDVPTDSVHALRRAYRDRFLFLLFVHTGLRAHEAAAADMTDLAPYTDPKTQRVYFGLHLRTQKGGGESTVLVPGPAVDAWRDYRRAYDLPETPLRSERLGLVLSPLTKAAGSSTAQSAASRRRNGKWMAVRSRQGVWAILRRVLRAGAKRAVTQEDSAAAEILNHASTHWLRHTRATNLVLQGYDMRVVAQALRHGDVSTTMNYTALDLLDVARALDQSASADEPRPARSK